ncbi:MAG: hypothetical protein RMJ19_08910 [Gemmatales bacterium]|nr:hypothetical protein [Gemmatales bacterium]MCS7160578.1 hypothetical protein [Gemmatales bacterium]MDW8175779.1 hypothetical protein [Gemmatales bacterium]MDW8222431.1 hypothetical protein [Gemmatales bacterium]
MTGLAWLIIGSVVLGVLVGAALAWRPLRRFYREIETVRAQELFLLQREYLEAKFFDTGAQSEKPRGLRWKECEWDKHVEFVRDRRNGRLLAFVGVNIIFEPTQMELGQTSWDEPRTATAVFHFNGRKWQVGRVLFNMRPDQVLTHYPDMERVEPATGQD